MSNTLYSQKILIDSTKSKIIIDNEAAKIINKTFVLKEYYYDLYNNKLKEIEVKDSIINIYNINEKYYNLTIDSLYIQKTELINSNLKLNDENFNLKIKNDNINKKFRRSIIYSSLSTITIVGLFTILITK